jgi:hypothetical protein
MANSFSDVATDLLTTIDTALPNLLELPAARASAALSPGKWSTQQVIGHLVDSAANNHQRFVRASQFGTLAFPAYIQNFWVDFQHYETRDWNDLVVFWHAYNRHLAHVMRQIPVDRHQVMVTIGESAPVTLEFLVRDYVVHLKHHLAQIADGLPDCRMV